MMAVGLQIVSDFGRKKNEFMRPGQRRCSLVPPSFVASITCQAWEITVCAFVEE
jgi:hypothetical protein